MTPGPIVLVEDDKDDQELYEEVLRNIGIPNELRFFSNGRQALEYLTETEEQPFIIISDINMPEMTGLELKKHIQEDPYLSSKGIPFVFLTTNGSKASIRHAHALSVQGYFEKPHNISSLTSMFQKIFHYWELCRHINNT